jgi:hypothetical protein
LFAFFSFPKFFFPFFKICGPQKYLQNHTSGVVAAAGTYRLGPRAVGVQSLSKENIFFV